MRARFGFLQYAIIGLTLATAGIHLSLAPKAGWPFWLNGIGYIALLLLLYWPAAALERRRNVIRWLLIAYVIATLAAWFSIGARSGIAYFDKAIEVVLLGLLWVEGQTRREPSSLSHVQ